MKKHLSLAFIYSLSFITCLHAQSSWTKVKEELIFEKPPFQECHASTMVETAGGKILLACFGGSQEGKSDVAIWLTSLHKKGAVSKPEKVATGVVHDSLRYPTWNPVLFKAREGKLFLFYKVGPNPREWWGMVKTSENNGRTWSTAQTLPENILGPIKNKPVQLADGTILSPSSIEENTERWKVHIEKSTDLGQTWQKIPVDHDSQFDVIQPSILVYPDDRIQILCRSKQGNVVQAWSTDGGNSWSELSNTSLLNPNSGVDAVTLKDGSHLIVYNPEVPGKDWFNGRGKLRVARSVDGQVWEDIVTLEDGTTEEYSYPAIIQTKDGLVHISYTYNRKNIKHVVLKPELD